MTAASSRNATDPLHPVARGCGRRQNHLKGSVFRAVAWFFHFEDFNPISGRIRAALFAGVLLGSAYFYGAQEHFTEPVLLRAFQVVCVACVTFAFVGRPPGNCSPRW
jgi:hypothetical protein